MLAISEQYVQLRHKASRQTTNCFRIVSYVADIVDSTWSSLVEGPALEALHAMVSHDTYCQKLLESDTLDPEIFQEVLSTLLPSAQLTFGACLARLATQHWDPAATKAREATVFSKESAPRGVVEPGSRLVYQDTLMAIGSHIQEAVLVSSFFIHLGASCPPQVLAIGFCECTTCCIEYLSGEKHSTHLCLHLERLH